MVSISLKGWDRSTCLAREDIAWQGDTARGQKWACTAHRDAVASFCLERCMRTQQFSSLRRDAANQIVCVNLNLTAISDESDGLGHSAHGMLMP